ncbi:MAG: cache domain-containing protein [Pseudomonadota bacterium]|nr:cache domain-containing protein [Pseudomonadota bacterium]
MNTHKNILFFTIFILLVGLVIFFLSLRIIAQQRQELLTTYTHQAENFILVFRKTVEMRLNSLTMAMEFLTRNQEIIEAFAQKQRAILKQETVPLFNQILKPHYQIKQFHFHLPPAVSFFRVHKPAHYGDDLTAFRQTVVVTNREQKPVRGLEVGRAGAGLRVIYPVHYQDQHIGSVEFGESLRVALELASQIVEMDYGLAIKDAVFTQVKPFHQQYTSDVTQGQFTFYEFSNPAIRTLFKQEPSSDNPLPIINTAQKDYFVHEFPLIDFSGKIVGKIQLIKEITTQLNHIEYWTSLGAVIIYMLIVIISLIIFLYFRKIRDYFEHIILRQQYALDEKIAICHIMQSKIDDFQQSKIKFIMEITQGLTTPLLSYQGYLKKFIADYRQEQDNPVIAEHFETVQHILFETNRLIWLVEDFRELEMIKIQAITWHDQPCQLNSLLETIVQAYQYSKIGVELHFIQTTELPEVAMDEERLRQLLTRLLQYALQHTQSGSITLSAEIKAHTLIIQVTYPGPIPNLNEQEILFDETQQFNQRLHRLSESRQTGLNLCVVAAIIQHYNGRFLFKPANQKGYSCLEVDFPISENSLLGD